MWLYHRFNLSHRDVEDLLAERGITVSYEAIRLWCTKVLRYGALSDQWDGRYPLDHLPVLAEIIWPVP